MLSDTNLADFLLGFIRFTLAIISHVMNISILHISGPLDSLLQDTTCRGCCEKVSANISNIFTRD